MTNETMKDGERAAFEACAVANGMHDLTRHGADEYLRDPVNVCWIIWQARAAETPAALTDEQTRQALLAGGLVCGAHNTHLIAEAIRSALAPAPTERMNDAEDAARYRWLREQSNDVNALPRIEVVRWEALDESANGGDGLRMDALDAAIDAARKAEIERSDSAGGEA